MSSRTGLDANIPESDFVQSMATTATLSNYCDIESAADMREELMIRAHAISSQAAANVEGK
jgi:hypothetical protein